MAKKSLNIMVYEGLVYININLLLYYVTKSRTMDTMSKDYRKKVWKMTNNMDLRTQFDIYVVQNHIRKYQIANYLGISEQALYKSLRKLTPEKLAKYKDTIDKIVEERNKVKV